MRYKVSYILVIVSLLLLVSFVTAIDNQTIANFTTNVTYGASPLPVQFTDQSINATNWSWYFGDYSAWTQLTGTASWVGRQDSSVVILSNGNIILMGGYGGGGPGYLNDTYRSLDGGATWTRISTGNGWVKRFGQTAVALPDDSIVVMGGQNTYNDFSPVYSGYMNDTWRSTDEGITWTLMNSSSGWTARYLAQSVALSDGSIVIMGGYTGTDASLRNDTWRSTDNGATWVRMNASGGWSARYRGLSTVLSDDSILVIGGRLSGSDLSNYTWRSTDYGASWTQMNASGVWKARSDFAGATTPDNTIYIIGGYDTPDMWSSIDMGVTWRKLANSTELGARAAFTMVPTQYGDIIAVGGVNGTLLRDVWKYSAANSSLQNPSHIFTMQGTNRIALQAYNVNSSNITYNNIILYVQTVTGFIANNTYGLPPLSVGFNVTSVNDNAITWNWSFGDGTYANTQNTTHVYTSNGLFTVTETAYNPVFLNITTMTNLINVYYVPSTAFIASPTSGEIPLNVTFTDISSNGPTSWNWSFGDGTYANTQNTSHTYSIAGTYTVILTTNNTLGSSNFSANITVLPSTPIATFTVNPNIGTAPLDVTFTDTSTGTIIGRNWNFGDGDVNYGINNTVVHSYNSLGTYYPTLTVTSIVGDNMSQPVPVYVITSPIPLVDFTGSPLSGTSPLSVQFTDYSVALNGINVWNWSFGDGNYSNLQNPLHVYPNSGQYSVTLVATSTDLLSNYTSKINYINVGISSNTVSANFTANQTNAPTYPASIQFTDTSVCFPLCTNWAWDFNNDGQIESVIQNPIYTYNYPGSYSPKLIISNGVNSGTKIRNLYITIGPTFVKPTITQPTEKWVPGYRDDTTGSIYSFRGDTSIDLANSTYLKYWLQNFTATGNFSIYGFAIALTAPIMHVFGFWIYLIIWGLYLFAVWIRSQDVTLPLIIGILSMGTFGLLFPKESLPVIIVMFVICGAIIITKLMKDSI